MNVQTKKKIFSKLALTSLCCLAALPPNLAGAGGDSELREQAGQSVRWRATDSAGGTIAVKLLAINDFHSQITDGLDVDGAIKSVAGRAIGQVEQLVTGQDAARPRPFFKFASSHPSATIQLPSAVLSVGNS